VTELLFEDPKFAITPPQQSFLASGGGSMDKPKFNFILDASMFLCVMALAGLGFLMKYVLPSGRDVWTKYGSNLYLSWLGWDRHDWGDIHLYLALTLQILLVLHIILHWRQILGLFQRLVPDPRRRYRIALVFLILSLLLIYFPFLITPDSKARGRGDRRSQVGGADARVAAAGPAGAEGGALSRPGRRFLSN
jgi:hypothetical protein